MQDLLWVRMAYTQDIQEPAFRRPGVCRYTIYAPKPPQANARLQILELMLLVSCTLGACGNVDSYGFEGAVTPSAGVLDVALSDGMRLVRVEGGPFIMGTDKGLEDEGPAHLVSLDPYWIDETEVTNAMYRGCVRGRRCVPPVDATYYDDAAYASHPVVFVSWRDAQAYCSWAGRRLPTEAEWEKAATWDSVEEQKRIYPWGNDFDCTRANFDDEINLDSFVVQGGPNCDGFQRSAPVGSYPWGASPSGALDMAGNVWEWVHDGFLETDPYSAQSFNYYAVSPPADPQGVDPRSTAYRVVRGASWNMDFGLGRSTYRLWFGMDEAYDGVGFRCARAG